MSTEVQLEKKKLHKNGKANEYYYNACLGSNKLIL